MHSSGSRSLNLPLREINYSRIKRKGEGRWGGGSQQFKIHSSPSFPAPFSPTRPLPLPQTFLLWQLWEIWPQTFRHHRNHNGFTVLSRLQVSPSILWNINYSVLMYLLNTAPGSRYFAVLLYVYIDAYISMFVALVNLCDTTASCHWNDVTGALPKDAERRQF